MNYKGIEFTVAPIEGDCLFMAFSAANPKFCFVKSDYSDVIKVAKEGIDFWIAEND